MRKAKPVRRGSSPKTTIAPSNVDEYLARVPEPARNTLQKLRATIRSVLPPETTEVISYGIPMFKYKGYLVGYAAFSKHCSLFPMGSSVIKIFQKELEDFPTSKGTIRFTEEKPLPPTLVKKLVKARIAQNEHKK
jgi:uncharacterized protein YdhG (YjbR/CyaY superfamily)